MMHCLTSFVFSETKTSYPSYLMDSSLSSYPGTTLGLRTEQKQGVSKSVCNRLSIWPFVDHWYVLEVPLPIVHRWSLYYVLSKSCASSLIGLDLFLVFFCVDTGNQLLAVWSHLRLQKPNNNKKFNHSATGWYQADRARILVFKRQTRTTNE